MGVSNDCVSVRRTGRGKREREGGGISKIVYEFCLRTVSISFDFGVAFPLFYAIYDLCGARAQCLIITLLPFAAAIEFSIRGPDFI